MTKNMNNTNNNNLLNNVMKIINIQMKVVEEIERVQIQFIMIKFMKNIFQEIKKNININKMMMKLLQFKWE